MIIICRLHQESMKYAYPVEKDDYMHYLYSAVSIIYYIITLTVHRIVEN